MTKRPKRIRPSREPQTVNENVWYYEHRSGIEVVAWATERDGTRSRRPPVHFKVPKKMLLATLARIDAPKNATA